MAILIAYYSRAGENYFGGSYRRIPVGNTRRVAEQLASLTGGDLLELRQAHPYSDDYRTCVAQARADWQQSARPEVLDLPEDLAGYDRIYLGYPNYCGTMPMVRSSRPARSRALRVRSTKFPTTSRSVFRHCITSSWPVPRRSSTPTITIPGSRWAA